MYWPSSADVNLHSPSRGSELFIHLVGHRWRFLTAGNSASPLVPNSTEHLRVAVAECVIMFLHFGGLILKDLGAKFVNDSPRISSWASNSLKPWNLELFEISDVFPPGVVSALSRNLHQGACVLWNTCSGTKRATSGSNSPNHYTTVTSWDSIGPRWITRFSKCIINISDRHFA